MIAYLRDGFVELVTGLDEMDVDVVEDPEAAVHDAAELGELGRVGLGEDGRDGVLSPWLNLGDDEPSLHAHGRRCYAAEPSRQTDRVAGALTTIESLLQRAADEAASRPALRWHDRLLTYGELDALVEACAGRLREAGVERGDRVAVVTANVPAAPTLLFAAWRIGAVAAPINDRLRSDDLDAALDAVDPTAAVVIDRAGGPPGPSPSELVERPGVRAALVAEPGGEIVGTTLRSPAGERVPSPGALVLTTSGSTGPPKAVLVDHKREVESSESLAERLALGTDDVTALAVSVSHAFGLSCLLTALGAQSETILVDSTTGAGPLVDALETATVVHGSPTLFASLAPHDRALPARLRTGFVAGASAPPALLDRMDAAGLVVLNLYGMTEIGAAAATQADDPPAVRQNTSGQALPGHELQVVDGELQVRGTHVSDGYFRQPERTAEAFVGEWLRTGDQATVDAAGNLTITGRLDDMVSIAGFNVSPAEVEACLLEHAGIVAAAVVSRPDERLGHRLVAYVEGRQGTPVESRDVLGHVRGRLAGYKVPYRVEFMDALPRLATGKPDRRALHRLAQDTDG